METLQNKATGNRIKELRVNRGLSQLQLGNLVNVSQDTVSLWENFKSLPTAETIIKLSNLFDVSADYLLGLQDI